MTPDSHTPTPHLILGGARSGKSAHAESLVTAHSPPYIYVATARVLDEEMKERVRQHQERRKDHWHTLETPLELNDALKQIPGNRHPVLLDCLTLWIMNLMLQPSGISPEKAIAEFCSLLPSLNYPLYIVSNEVGAGIVPDNPLARRFRDLAGSTNQSVAAVCRAVTLVVAGIPLRLK